jgi:hypothetical protein
VKLHQVYRAIKLAALFLFTAGVGLVVAQSTGDLRSAGSSSFEEIDSGFNTDDPNLYGLVAGQIDGTQGYVYKTLVGGEGSSGETSDAAPGLIPSLGRGIAFLYTPPASSEIYIADLLNSSGIATPAYAQGLGFASLNPILSAWKTFRNVAYFFFVLIMLIIGFMIILGRKLGGQSAITVQQAIPNIIISLLAVTFSYAIAGLLIDLMYLVMFLILGVFGYDQGLLGKNFLQLGTSLVTSSAGTTFDAVHSFVKGVTSTLGGAAGEIAGIISGLTFAVIVAIAVAVGLFRLFFELLKTYITIIVNIVLAPLLLMMGAIPGRSTFGGWVKSLAANLAAFPAVLLILILYYEITGGDEGNGGFLPPFLLGRGNADAIAALVGIAFIIVMKETVVEIKKALGASDGVIGSLMQQAWNKVPGKGIAPALVAGAPGAALGAGLGAAYAASKGQPIGKGALKGAALGGVGTGLVASGGAYRIAKGAAGDVMTIGRQMVVGQGLSRMLGNDESRKKRGRALQKPTVQLDAIADNRRRMAKLQAARAAAGVQPAAPTLAQQNGPTTGGVAAAPNPAAPIPTPGTLPPTPTTSTGP